MTKKRISTQEHREIINEIKHCEKAIETRFDVYVANAISRLIMARLKLENSWVEERPDIEEKSGTPNNV